MTMPSTVKTIFFLLASTQFSYAATTGYTPQEVQLNEHIQMQLKALQAQQQQQMTEFNAKIQAEIQAVQKSLEQEMQTAHMQLQNQMKQMQTQLQQQIQQVRQEAMKPH